MAYDSGLSLHRNLWNQTSLTTDYIVFITLWCIVFRGTSEQYKYKYSTNVLVMKNEADSRAKQLLHCKGNLNLSK